MNFEKIMNNENQLNNSENNLEKNPQENVVENQSEIRPDENLESNQEFADQARIQELRKELKMLIDWNQVDGHPDDYKRIDEVRSKIEKLESENFSETIEGTGVDLDSVDIKNARYGISLDAELFELYKKSKEVVYSMTPDEGPMIKRKDVIIEMIVALKSKEDSNSDALLNRLLKILKESRL